LGLAFVDGLPAMSSLLRIAAAAIRHLCHLVVAALVLTLAPGAGSAQSPDSNAVATAPTALVYVFRAMGGKVFSKEMDNLAGKIKARGYEVQVFNYTGWMRPAKDAAKRYRTDVVKPRIIAIGHSAGGDSAIRFALSLKRAQVPVDLIITLDPTRIANRVPANVGRFVNIYSSEHTFGGGDPTPAPDFNGHFASVDLKDYSDIWHIYMPGMAGLQDAVVAKIAEAVAVPAAADESAVPIDYALPKDAPFELWDSGVTVVAGGGETAAMVAAQFGVPAWAVAGINQVVADAPLAAGQRLVVPRHLAASAGPSN
jgi:hypothetical protein